ncbi:MAG: hypothetical protein EBZ07_08030 [Verrucomicrobia bacterium]|nr:hypothetical protein [Verrucomicrobiota bacterium]
MFCMVPSKGKEGERCGAVPLDLMMPHLAGLCLPECAREQTGPVRLTNGPPFVIRQWPGIVKGPAADFVIMTRRILRDDDGLTAWQFANIAPGNFAGNVKQTIGKGFRVFHKDYAMVQGV